MTYNVLFVPGVDGDDADQEFFKEALEKYLNDLIPGQSRVYMFNPKPYFKRNWLEHLVKKVPLLSMTADVMQYLFRYRGAAAEEVDRAFMKELAEREYGAIVGHSLGTVIIAKNAAKRTAGFVGQLLQKEGKYPKFCPTVALFQSPLYMPFWTLFAAVPPDWVEKLQALFTYRLIVYSRQDWISKDVPDEVTTNQLEGFAWDIYQASCDHDFAECLDKLREKKYVLPML